ncbi:sensor histidine kinase [Trinickia dinghuensis]|uniref:Sensor histidine kinase n=1 Tax=Trinickia dinghuensis TaxID=2291023 RepID=A0A3D8JXQ9_9BURK|nr:sensor histidine kinase [Trinickia dinghuensis]RDU97602.1 sensor histidine kinase [Trinickia dinghuensis]
MKPSDVQRPSDPEPSAPACDEAHAITRAIELAARLVREQEARVAHFDTDGAERQAAQALLDTLRVSLALSRRYRLATDGEPARPDGNTAGSEPKIDVPAVVPAAEPAGDMQTAREEERKRIAQELHDDLGQQLSALELTAQRVERLAAAPKPCGRLDAAIRDLHEQIDSAVVSVQRMTRQLQPLALERLGFPAAVESLAAEFANRSNVRLACRFRMDGVDVSEPAATAIFRIVQEALTNVARHASAQTVTIDFYRDGEVCMLRIADDGVGNQSPTGKPPRLSLGLSGMADRAAQFEGTLSIRSTAGTGFAIVVRLPLASIARRP